MQNHSGARLKSSSAEVFQKGGQLPSFQYADVAVPVHVAETFTYRLTEQMRGLAQVGQRVVVPLGRKLTTGYLVALRESLEPNSRFSESEIKDAEELIDSEPVITPEVLEATHWVSEYYAAPWGEVLKAALPPGISESIELFLSITAKGLAHLEELAGRRAATMRGRVLLMVADKGEISLREISNRVGRTPAVSAVRELGRSGLIERNQRPFGKAVKAKQQRAVRLLSQTADPARKPHKITEAQQRVIGALQNGGGVLLLQDLLVQTKSGSAIKSLEKRGAIELFERAVRRDPLAEASVPVAQEHVLTQAQATVLREIEEPLRLGVYSAFLLHGVTGSGKTEVYMRAMRAALELGRAAMMLVPEIALTPVFSLRLRSQFGDQVAIFHSSLSKGERFDEWSRVKNGEARIVIGTRSAVFAPISKLGLVIVDEEHESTYRQQDSPCYNGRDTAIVRAQKESAVVVLGSATPSLESFHNSRIGKYRYLQLPDRIANRPLATARIIDMREVFAEYGHPRVFSDRLLTAIDETHQRGEQSIILLNRRGYSSFVLCRSCGESIHCPNCDVTLTYHRSERVIVCHYCNHRQAAPSQCPLCHGKYIYYLGEGTEQIEEMLGKLFPALRIARIDRDTASRRRFFERSLLEFSSGKLDMLVGTQMLAKGHDFPNVTLVGVVSVDAGLALPDFRAAERTFQLLTQVAGRAGRGDRAGHVLIQTYHPDHYALRHACAQDYLGFYTQEIRYRQNHVYPPFIALASILAHGRDHKSVRSAASELRKQLDLANKERNCRVLGPAPAPLARLKGENRIQLLVKARSRRQLRKVVDIAIAATISHGHNSRGINLEIDPISTM